MMFRRFRAAACLLCALGVTGVGVADDAEKVTYKDHVQPIFRQRCGSCHNANDKKGGLAVDNYATLMAGGSSGTVVEGGAPDASYLWQLVNHESEPKMPPNADKLPETELAVIKKWIEGGLLETSGSTAKIKKSMAVAKIEVSTERPADIAMPQAYLGDSQVVTSRTNAVTALATSPWAPLAAVSSFRQIAVYNSATLELLGVLPFPEGQAEILKFSRNGALLMAGGGRGGASGKVVLFDVKTGARVAEIGDEYDVVLAADVSPDHSQVALGGPKKMLRVYSVETGELMYENKKHTDWVTAIEFSPDGVLLASGDRANGLIVWEAVTGRPFQDLLGHTAAVTDVSWRPDSNVVASSSEDGTIRLWEMNNGTQIKAWNHSGAAAMDYTRDGRLVSAGRDRVVRLWSGDGAQEREFAGMTDLGMEVAFDAESNRVLGGDWSGIVRVWNAADGTPVGQFDTNPPTIALQLEKLTPQVAAAEAAAQQAATQLTALTGERTGRQQAAEAAAAAATAAADKAQQTAAARVETDKLLAEKAALKATADKSLADTQSVQQSAQQVLDEKNAALKAAEEALLAAQAAFAAATKEQETAAAAVAAADANAKSASATAAAAQTAAETLVAAEKAAAETAAQLKAAAEAAAAAAQPTPEQDQALAAAQAAAAAAQQQLDAIRALITRLQTAASTQAQAAVTMQQPAAQ